MIMGRFPEDIYTEPSNLDVDTLRNLGPITGMAEFRNTLTRIGEPTPNPLAR